MNRPPEILVNTGYVTDENGVLTEMVIPNNVVTQNAPSIVTTYATTINWIPSTTTALVELHTPGIVSISGTTNFLSGYTNLTTYSAANLESLTWNGKMFNNCTKLANLNLPKVKTITTSAVGSFGIFADLTALETATFQQLEYIVCNTYGYMFTGCTNLQTITLPKIKFISIPNTNSTGMCNANLALSTVTLGSAGNPVSSIGTTAFYGCSQSGLTITVYTQDGAALAGEPWGATNATIEYEEA